MHVSVLFMFAVYLAPESQIATQKDEKILICINISPLTQVLYKKKKQWWLMVKLNRVQNKVTFLWV